MTDAELAWVTEALDLRLPRRPPARAAGPERRTSGSTAGAPGSTARCFGSSWSAGICGRAVSSMEVPDQLFTAPLPVVAAYLRSVFQAEGFVSAREASTVVEVDMISEQLIRGMQQLLLRFGIYSRVGFKPDARVEPQGCWTLRIQNDRRPALFADEIGFIDPVKADEARAELRPARTRARARPSACEIDRIEELGAMEVYDIQTESGEYLSGQPAGPQLLHPRRRRHDGLDPGVVPGRGPDLQGRLRRRRQPVQDPVEQGAAVLRRHRQRPGLASCAAPTPRPARSSPAAPPAARPRWSCSTWTTRTWPTSSRPRRARKRRSGCSATPGSTWTWAARTSPASSTRTPTTRSGSPTSSCTRSRRARSSTCWPGAPARSSSGSTRAS